MGVRPGRTLANSVMRPAGALSARGLSGQAFRLDLLAETIPADLARAALPVRHALAVTCLDQVGERITVWHEDRAQTISPDHLRGMVRSAIGDSWIGGHGLMRETLETAGAGFFP